MKTSNKILIGFVATIFIVITAAFIDIRVFGVHRSVDNRTKKTYNFDLGQYKYLKVDNVPSLEIRPSSTNHLNFIAYGDTLDLNIEFRVENDTLFLLGSKNNYRHFSLYTESEFESIISVNSKIEFKGLHQDSIKLYLDKGEINSWGKDASRMSTFGKVYIHQENSRLNFHNLKVDTVVITMNKSKAGFSRDINFVQASIKNNSNLDLKNAAQLIMEKDNGSRIYMR